MARNQYERTTIRFVNIHSTGEGCRQYRISIPKGMAEEMKLLNGQPLEWKPCYRSSDGELVGLMLTRVE